MKGIHPKKNRGATCLLAAALFAMGCRSTSSGVNNPFLAPDRVAPPSTRVLAPGQAQPYYQGDPLPTMQSATGAASSSPVAADNAAARSASGKTLGWNAPSSGASTAATPANVIVPWGAAPQASVPIVRANEGAVSVPADTDSLRFALPNPAVPQGTTGLATNSISGPSPTLPAAPAANQGVSLASYNAPATNSLVSLGVAPALSPTPQAASAWRSPQFGNSASPTFSYGQAPTVASPVMSQPFMSPAAPAYASAQTPTAMPTNQMAVELRSVPSPPQPGDPIPRVRIPGYDVPETASTDGFRARHARHAA